MSQRRLLFVCEGNVCRSPYAAIAFRERWETLGGVRPTVVTSAGTRAPVGAAAHALLGPLVESEASRTELAEHRARQVDAATVRTQDLVITMERAHRGDVLDLVPAALRRTFTLGEVERLGAPVLDDWTDDTLRQDDTLHELLGRRRAVVGAAPATGDDIDDPVGGDSSEFRAMARRVDTAVDELVALLARFDAATSAQWRSR